MKPCVPVAADSLATTGQFGQRPTHGRAGAGLASPVGTGAGSHDGCGATIRKIVLTLALTFYPLPQERKSAAHALRFSADHPANPVARISMDTANVKALSLGRWLGEGGRETILTECGRPRPLQCPNGDALLPFQRCLLYHVAAPEDGRTPSARDRGKRPAANAWPGQGRIGQPGRNRGGQSRW
jgi:hypothetical protein